MKYHVQIQQWLNGELKATFYLNTVPFDSFDSAMFAARPFYRLFSDAGYSTEIMCTDKDWHHTAMRRTDSDGVEHQINLILQGFEGSNHGKN